MNETKMTHCPKCHKPLLNGAKFLGNAQFNLRCPWCQAVVTVTVQQQIVANLRAAEGQPPVSPELKDFYASPSQESEGQVQVSGTLRSASGEGFKVVGFLYPHLGGLKPEDPV